MSAVLDNRRLSADEYLRWDADQPDKHEYIAGEVWQHAAMSSCN